MWVLRETAVRHSLKGGLILESHRPHPSAWGLDEVGAVFESVNGEEITEVPFTTVMKVRP